MPDMDGAALGQATREQAALADLPLVLLTSLGEPGDARRFAARGFAAYATKPLRHQELKGILSLVLVPGAPGAEAPLPLATRHLAREVERPFAGHPARVLLAEDNPTNQQVALGLLKRLGLTAHPVTNGAEALRALAAEPFDLVLMDVQMPELDGFVATRIIRDPASAVLDHGVPIVAMTAHALYGDRERCLAAGMDDYLGDPKNVMHSFRELCDAYLVKPIHKGQLVEKLRELGLPG